VRERRWRSEERSVDAVSVRILVDGLKNDSVYNGVSVGIWREEINFQKKELIEAILRERRWRSEETELVMACRWEGGLMA